MAGIADMIANALGQHQSTQQQQPQALQNAPPQQPTLAAPMFSQMPQDAYGHPTKDPNYTLFGPDGSLGQTMQGGMFNSVTPEPYMQRLNALQSFIPEVRSRIDRYVTDEDWRADPTARQQRQEEMKLLQDLERERDLILQRHNPQGFRESRAPGGPKVG